MRDRRKSTRAPGPPSPEAIARCTALQRRLSQMALGMRRWGTELRELAENLVPFLPDEETRLRLANDGAETLPIALYHSTDGLIAESLAPAIVDFERWARATEDEPVPEEEAGDRDRVWREIDPQAPEPQDPQGR